MYSTGREAHNTSKLPNQGITHSTKTATKGAIFDEVEVMPKGGDKYDWCSSEDQHRIGDGMPSWAGDEAFNNIYPFQQCILDWVRRDLGDREEDKLVVKAWITLHSRSGNVFNSTDDATEDFYNFIEYLAIEGISDLCYRVADFLALEEALGEPPGELGQVKGQELENNEGTDDI